MALYCSLYSTTSLSGHFDLVTKRTSSVVKLLLVDSRESTKDDELKNEVGKGTENDEVMEAGLDLAHLAGPPVGNPVDHPEEVADESHCKKKHQFDLVVLKKDELGKHQCRFA